MLLESQINQKINSNDPGTDVGYWESLLQQLKAHMARVSTIVFDTTKAVTIMHTYIKFDFSFAGQIEGQTSGAVEKETLLLEAAG